LVKPFNLEADFQFVEASDGTFKMVSAFIGRDNKIIPSRSSPSAIHKMMDEKRNLLTRFANRNPLFALPRNDSIHEISVPHGGVLFDLEFPMVWNRSTGQKVDPMERIWI
jgi:hypothetical protein